MDHILRRLLQSDTNAHHVLSFNHLVAKHIPDLITMYGTTTTMISDHTFSLRITDVTSAPTRPSAWDCHIYGLNYLFCVQGCITMYRDDVAIKSIHSPLAFIPMMTGRTVLSTPRKPGADEPFSGLFISKGKCRTIPPTKSLQYNIPIRLVRNGLHILQVRSSHRHKIYRSTSTFDMSIDNLGIVTCKLPFQPAGIHLRILVLALGGTIPDFQATCVRLAGSSYAVDLFSPMFTSLELDGMDIETSQDAIMHVSKLFGRKLESTGLNVLRNEMFPHLGTDFLPKLHYLCMCATQLLLFKLGTIGPTPRDDYAMSQITTSAGHLGTVFRLIFIGHMRTCGKLMRRMMTKDPDSVDIVKVYGEHRISARIMSAVASGIWSAMRKGVSINLNTNNFDAIESQLRRISSSLATTNGNHTVPRNVMSDQYGFICAASSPDGESTGLIYEMGLTATITPPVGDVTILVAVIQALLGHLIMPVETWLTANECGDAFLYVDAHGAWVGCIPDPARFIREFRQLRRGGHISPFVFIDSDNASRLVRITHQEGILCRPLLVAGREGDIPSEFTIGHLLCTGIIEYVSPAEQSSVCRIAVSLDAVTDRSTHVELTQASFLGKLAASVAFATGQQGPRLAYSTLQRKQIITGGTKRFRGANESNCIWNTHRPLVQTKVVECLAETRSVHRGVPVVLAFIALPQNQEDAIVVKRSTLQRGAFMMSDNREYTSEAPSPGPNRTEQFERPDAVISRKNVSYKCIGEDGMPAVGTHVPGGSVIIGKTRIVKRTSICKDDVLGSVRKCDISTCTKPTDDGVVTTLDRFTMPNGIRVRAVVTSTRMPAVGDKFTSQYAQKGVIGAIWDDVDMPFSSDTGISPDMIVSPLSMTSRMTMSSLLEALCGKSVSVSGDYSVGVDHQNYKRGHQHYQMVCESMLRKHGFRSDGTERFIDGRTGVPILARLFVGVVDYYRLVHIAAKKIHARSTGPRDPLTRQPRDGRRFGGGLRIGEMESSALAAHGSSRVLQERFRELSDAFEIYVCSICHTMCDDVCRTADYQFCRRCRSDENIQSVLVPFTFLVMTLELLATGIVTQFIVETPPPGTGGAYATDMVVDQGERE